MCRLVGVAGKIFDQERRAFRNLLELGAYNSPHSTGIALVDKDNNFKLMKALDRPWHLYADYPDDFTNDDLVKGFSMKAIIGHNRFATTGKKIAENAHPFHHDNIVGAHNGTLDKSHLHRIDGNDKFDVDSEALIYSFNKNGWKETLNNTKGAWALVWYDKRDSQLNFIRNTERPLHWTWTLDKQNFYWASEEWMLETALGTAGVKHQQIKEFDPYQRHYLKLNGDGSLGGEKLYYEPEEVKGFVPPPFVYAGKGKGGDATGNNPFRETAIGQNTGQKNTTTSLVTTRGDKEEGYREVIDGLTRAKVNTVISFQTYGERTNKGAMAYVLCDSKGIHDSYEIRIYSEFNPRHEEWRDSQKYFLGRVKSAVCNWDPLRGKYDRYVTLDMRTISEGRDEEFTVQEIIQANASPKKYEVIVIDKKKPDTNVVDLFKNNPPPKSTNESTIILGSDLKWDPAREYVGYQGRVLTFSQYMSAIKNGCSECGQEPSPDEVDKLVWVGSKQFVCVICDHRHRTEAVLKKHNIT